MNQVWANQNLRDEIVIRLFRPLYGNLYFSQKNSTMIIITQVINDV